MNNKGVCSTVPATLRVLFFLHYVLGHHRQDYMSLHLNHNLKHKNVKYFKVGTLQRNET